MALPQKSYNIPKGKPGKINKLPKWESDGAGDEQEVSKAMAKADKKPSLARKFAKANPLPKLKKTPEAKAANKAKRYIDAQAVKAMAKKAKKKK